MGGIVAAASLAASGLGASAGGPRAGRLATAVRPLSSLPALKPKRGGDEPYNRRRQHPLLHLARPKLPGEIQHGRQERGRRSERGRDLGGESHRELQRRDWGRGERGIRSRSQIKSRIRKRNLPMQFTLVRAELGLWKSSKMARIDEAQESTA